MKFHFKIQSSKHPVNENVTLAVVEFALSITSQALLHHQSISVFHNAFDPNSFSFVAFDL